MTTKPQWRDITTYGRSSGGRETEPTTWRLDIGQISLIITNGHIHYTPLWVMHCYALNINTFQIQQKGEEMTLEQAKAKAIEVICDKINKLAEIAKQL